MFVGEESEISHRGIRIARRGKRWRWQARFGGEVVVQSFQDLADAIQALDDLLDSRRRFSQRPMGPTVGGLVDRWFEFKKVEIAPATARQYAIHIRVHIKPLIGDVPASLLRPFDLQLFYRSLRWKPAKESHNILRQAFDWGLLNGIVLRDANPCIVARPSRRSSIDHDGTYESDPRIRAVSEKDLPTRAELEKLLVDAEENRQTWWLYLKLATTTGARPGEVCALRRGHINEHANTVRIEWSADRVSGMIKRPKTASGIRTLHLPAKFFEDLRPLLPVDPEAFLFPSNTQPGAVSPLPCWNSRGVKRRLDAALARTGIRHVTPHSFRHFVATHLLAQGWPPLQVARFLGHANDSLVRTLYANHIVDETQRLIGDAAANLV